MMYVATLFFCGDEKLTIVPKDYKAGRLLTGQLKARCIEVLQNFVKEFQDVRISSATLRSFPS